MKQITQFFKSDPYRILILLIFLSALFFRIYKLPEYATFLGDQGRDAIVIKDIVTLKHFTAIGPVSSIGGVFLGPFFYYFMAPWLAIFLLNPVGLAFGNAIINSFGVIIVYQLLIKLFNKQLGLIVSILYAFSYTLIEFSRFSWNPNILPLFVFIYVYLFLQLLNQPRGKTAIIIGMFFAFCMQLHYSVVFLGISSAVVWVYLMIKGIVNREKFPIGSKGIVSSHKTDRNNIRISLIVVTGFILGYIPLILFDIRHKFLNLNSLFKMFSEEKTHILSLSERIISSFGYLLTFFTGIPISGKIGLILIAVLIMIFTWKEKFNKKSLTIIILFIGSLLGTAWFMDARIPHYYNVMYPFLIILLSYLLLVIWKAGVIGRIAVIILIGIFLYFNLSKATFITHEGSNQIGRAKKVAKIIHNDIPKNIKYTLTTLPHRYDDYSYRYFLEIWNKYPTSKEIREQADLLYVVCPEACTPIGDPGWDVAFFAPNKIDKQWKVDHVTIYRLSR